MATPVEPADPGTAVAPQKILRIELLGVPTWRSTGGSGRLKHIDAVLLASLAIRGSQERDALAQWLWPTVDLALATANLRQRISRLRRETRHELLAAGSSVTLLDSVSVDVHDPLDGLTPENLLARGELLAGADYADRVRMNQWVFHERERYRRCLADALTGRAAQMEKAGEWAAALRLGEHIVALVPVLEVAWRRQMRLHYLRGDRAAAIDTFERFESIVSTQQGTRPSEETIELLATIERTPVAPARRAMLPVSLVRPPVLVGRDAHWQAMTRAWASGRPFLLRGDAGMGKSRLLADFLQDTAGVALADGRPGDEPSAYAVLTRLLRAVLRAHPVTPDDFTRRELGRILVEFGPAPEGTIGQQSAMWQAVENLLLSAQQAGLVALVLDDVQFADVASLEALRWLSASRALSALRFGFATRLEQGAERCALLDEWLVDSQRPEAIDLSLLTRPEIERLIASLGLRELDAEAVGEMLFLHAGGHPFLTLETVKDLVLRDTAWGKNEVLPRPTTAQPLLERRLRGVPEAQADLLQLAAVMGGDLTMHHAAAVLQRGLDDIVADFAALESCQVFNGRGFAHDLLRECALHRIPEVRRAALHGAVAEALSGDADVSPARLGYHWEAAERWPEAGSSLHAAGKAARVAGRLLEQRRLLERAAQCWRRAGNVKAEFEAMRDGTESLLVREGPAALLEELPRLEALALTPEHELTVLVLRAEALAHLFRGKESLQASTRALQLAEPYPELLVEALTVHGMALAQCGRHEEAIQAHRRGAANAERLGLATQAIRLTHMPVVLLYEAGRIGEAIAAARESARLTRAHGDPVEAAQVEGNLCTLLMLAGNPADAYAVARRVQREHEVMGSSANSIMGGMNLLCVGNVAAFMGRYDEALDALKGAVRKLGESTPAKVRAMARVSLANLWLTLGSPNEAQAALPPLPEDTLSGLQMLWHWAHARIEAMEGRAADQHLRRIGEIQAANPALPLAQSAWQEWSRQGEAGAVVQRLRQVRGDCERAGLPGLARSLMLREVDRLAEVEGGESVDTAARLATELAVSIDQGLHATTYLPEAWLILARAWERAGEQGPAARARTEAREWVLARSREHLPPGLRDGFLRRNPVNRELLG